MNWYVEVIRKYATFTGRARRKEFWMFFLISTIASIILGTVDGVFSGVANGVFGSSDIRVTVLSSLYSLFVLIPTVAVGVRRLHDTGKSGWWMLLGILPLANIALIVFFIQEGVAGPNEYGPDPKAAGAPVGYAAPVAASVPAGWLPDPTHRHQMRYWDAVRWTDHVSDNGVAAVDPVQA